MKFALIALIVIIAAACLYGIEDSSGREDFQSIHQLQYEEHETDSHMPMHEEYETDTDTYYYILAGVLIIIIMVTVYRYRRYEDND
ncbi:MAG: hypothetical protein SVK54_01410 [candidate division WOR-3 bacterium]|nr:hypothetical protein [candidate division WOR-3 bacterium]